MCPSLARSCHPNFSEASSHTLHLNYPEVDRFGDIQDSSSVAPVVSGKRSTSQSQTAQARRAGNVAGSVLRRQHACRAGTPPRTPKRNLASSTSNPSRLQDSETESEWYRAE